MAEENNQNMQSAEVQQAVTQALDEQKKKKRKKRLIIIGVILAVIIIIAVIGSSGSDDGNKSDSTTASVSAQKEEKADGEIGSYVCTVKEAKLCKDWEGKDSVKITYSFTNNSSDSESFDVALDDNVYQDGVGLESTWIDDEEDDFGVDVKIKPGTTKEVIKVYQLRNKNTDLEVEIGEWLSFDDTKITTTVKIEK